MIKFSVLQGYFTNILFSWLPLNKDIFRSQESSCCPEHYRDKIRGWTEGCKKRWMEHCPYSFPTLGFYGVHFHLVLHLPVIYQMTTSHLPGFLKWFLLWHLLPFLYSNHLWTAYGLSSPRNPVRKLVEQGPYLCINFIQILQSVTVKNLLA